MDNSVIVEVVSFSCTMLGSVPYMSECMED